MNVPFNDLAGLHKPLENEIAGAMREVMESCAFIDGPAVRAFERDFATLCGVPAAMGVANGTVAVEMALRALGVGPGDEVICPAMTFIASVEPVVTLGARPVLVDILPGTRNLDPSQLAAASSDRTKAIIAVHLHGNPAPMEEILAFARPRGIKVVEDAAQGHGASLNGRPVGSMGDMAAFSFYPGKNLGAFGDAGAVVSADAALLEEVRPLINHGSRPGRKYYHDLIGFNMRMDTLQAAVLGVKLPHLSDWNRRRREIAAYYNQRLAGVVELPVETPGGYHTYHVYAVQLPRRDQVLQSMQQAGIGVGMHYPVAIHQHQAIASLPHPPQGPFPVAEAMAKQTLSLPMFPNMTDAQAEQVCTALLRAIDAGGGL